MSCPASSAQKGFDGGAAQIGELVQNEILETVLLGGHRGPQTGFLADTNRTAMGRATVLPDL